MIGDHIRARKNGRWNHAIDCGDRTVITLAEDPALAPGDRVRRMYRPEFEAGADAVEVVNHRARTFPPRQVVARAFSRAREDALPAMFADSAQFAAWCKVGRFLEGPQNVALAVPGVPVAKAPKRNGAMKAASVAKVAVRVAKGAKAAVKATGKAARAGAKLAKGATAKVKKAKAAVAKVAPKAKGKPGKPGKPAAKVAAKARAGAKATPRKAAARKPAAKAKRR